MIGKPESGQAVSTSQLQAKVARNAPSQANVRPQTTSAKPEEPVKQRFDLQIRFTNVQGSFYLSRVKNRTTIFEIKQAI